VKTTLAVVAGGDNYIRYAYDLFESAREHFHPTPEVECVLIPGDEGWPNGTMMRYHHLLENWPDGDYIFLSDADMRFENLVGGEIISNGITATVHPGYVITPPELLPFDDNGLTAVELPFKKRYYCGGFVGGQRSSFRELALRIRATLEAEDGRVPLWHDESVLNSHLAFWEPDVILSPSYCYPDNDSWYKTFWPENYKRRLVALDKPQEERGER
jgi:histo-blood group ABO system transferase